MPFQWNDTKSAAALALAQGLTQTEAAAEAGITARTIRRWLRVPAFAAEVDRLTHMVSVASRAERLRVAFRVIRQMTAPGQIETGKDLLDWLKYVQSETDGVRLDLLAAAGAFVEDGDDAARG